MKYKAALKADVIFYSNTHTMMHIFLRLCLSLRFILNNIILFKHLNNFFYLEIQFTYISFPGQCQVEDRLN